MIEPLRMSLPLTERLIDTAIRLIESGDPKSFSVAKVAKELGISQGNVTLKKHNQNSGNKIKNI